MTARVAAARREPAPRGKRGVIGTLLASALAVLGAAAVALLGSIALEWVGIAVGWWQGYHAMELLIAERRYIEAIAPYPLTVVAPLNIAARAWAEVDGTAQWLGLSGSAGLYVVAAVNTAKLVALRLTICLFTLPAFVLVAVIALLDGLVARDIRKYTGGHESAYVFHKAKRFVIPSLGITITLYLMCPISVPPVAMFAPTLTVTGLMIYTAASRFKKFL